MNSLARQLRSTILQLETANRKLQQDLDLQQEVDRMRKGFTAAASHEFKTPLTLLRGYLEMLQENRLPEGSCLSFPFVFLGYSQIQQFQDQMIQAVDFLHHHLTGFLLGPFRQPVFLEHFQVTPEQRGAQQKACQVMVENRQPGSWSWNCWI